MESATSSASPATTCWPAWCGRWPTRCVSARRAGAAKRRTWTTLRYGAKSWKTRRRVVARLEATKLGLDVRYVVTSLTGSAKHLYETIYCGRGQAENFIKLHKAQLASDRTSCRDPRANQMRLILHTAAYWLLHTLRAAAPKALLLEDGRVHHAAIAADQDRCPRRRGRRSHPPLAADGLPGRGLFRLLAGRFAAAGP